MRRYRLLTPASKDLTSILEYLDAHSTSAAARFLTRLHNRLELLAKHPDSGHKRSEFGHDDLRYITLDAYIIAYFPKSKPLTIVAILHGSRDLTSLLKISR